MYKFSFPSNKIFLDLLLSMGGGNKKIQRWPFIVTMNGESLVVDVAGNFPEE